VTAKEFSDAAGSVDASFKRALNRAAANIKRFHEQQVRRSWMQTDRPGTLLGQLIHPVDAAGVYVPGARGGETPLVSSVLMGVIPAKVAGVKQIVMVTPPKKGGGVSPHLLVAAKKAGVDAVYKAGSAWAIAALAYGTETIPKVDVIVGPGNIYVTLAKKILAGTVGIDMIAGPSEILIIADGSARPDFIAADLLSQAEHDVLSSSLFITDSQTLAQATVKEIKAQLANLPRAEIARESLAKYGAIIVVENIGIAVEMANRIAPEHLELQTRDPFEVVGKIRNAGAVFLGDYTPEPVGDYIAGPNHVLPTAGTARFASALSVDNFIKKTSLIQYTKKAFEREAPDIIRLAEIEGLGAHAGSIKIRL
jgi:histidinol dehydrogenase